MQFVPKIGRKEVKALDGIKSMQSVVDNSFSSASSASQIEAHMGKSFDSLHQVLLQAQEAFGADEMGADAVEVGSPFIYQVLTAIESKVLETKYEGLDYRSYAPIGNDGGVGAEQNKWYSWKPVGEAKVITAGDRALPLINDLMEEHSAPVVPIGVAFEFSWMFEFQEQMAREWVKMLKVSDPFQRAVQYGSAAFRFIEQIFQKFTLHGSAKHNIEGLLTDLNSMDTAKVAFTSGGTTDADRLWSTKKANGATGWQEIYDDMTECVDAPGVNTFSNNSDLSDPMSFSAKDLFIDDISYNIAKNFLHPETNKSVIEVFRTNHPNINIHVTSRLRKTAFVEGTLAGFNVMIAYDAMNIDLVKNYIPMPPTLWKTKDTKEGNLYTPVYAKKGSFRKTYPMAISVRYGH